MNLFDPDFLTERREQISASEDLSTLAQRLDHHLGPLRGREVWLPDQKPLLSREGGVCPADGARLEFRPMSPDAHWCPVCGAVAKGELHDRAWSWRYHIWLSERALQAALLFRLDANTDGLQLAADIINAYTARYRTYPNRDNVLGPSRLFFSTYLESIWLTQIITAASLVQGVEPRDRGVLDVDAVEGVVAESAQIIASFDEGFSNRQVWNNVAIAAAGRYLEDRALSGHAVSGPHGLRSALQKVVSADGRWHEGENYHFFALQGFQLGAELLAGTRLDLWEGDSAQRLGRMFTAPLDTLLPDLTFPARGDSPFGVSVSQPRFAQLWEVGRARTGSKRLAGILNAIYSQPGESVDCGFEEISEVETHRPAGRVARSDLGWKMLVWGIPIASAPDQGWSGTSRVLGSTGPVVIRPDRDRYVLLETGTGAGHGHPDALHLSIFDGKPWLLDPGTASYVSPSLFWYRSTLAHNAPGIPEVGQRRSLGSCTAFQQKGDWAFAEASVEGLGGRGVDVVRRIVVGPEYVFDLLVVDGPPDLVIDLPYHPVATAQLPEQGEEETASGAGYDSLKSLRAAPHDLESVRVGGPDAAWEIVLGPTPNVRPLLAEAPGPPTLAFSEGSSQSMFIRRLTGPGQLAAAYANKGVVTGVHGGGGEWRVTGKEISDSIKIGSTGVVITRRSGERIALSGLRPAAPVAISRPQPVPHIWGPMIARDVAPRDWVDHVPWNAIHPLKEQNYRRSEQAYPGAHAFLARVATWARRSEIIFAVDVDKPEVTLFDPTASPRLDNEPPEIHSDGVQCYWSTPAAFDSWNGLVAAVTRDGLHMQSVTSPETDLGSVRSSVFIKTGGYRLIIRVDTGRPIRPQDKYRFNIVVNEMRPGRMRRAGQLAFVGGGGWVYLRGDREPMELAAVAEVK